MDKYRAYLSTIRDDPAALQDMHDSLGLCLDRGEITQEEYRELRREIKQLIQNKGVSK